VVEIVVTGNIIFLSALLMQAHPSPAALHEIIPDLHPQDRPDTREAVSHETDQGPVAQSDLVGLVRRSTLLVHFDDGNAVEQRAGLVGGQNRRFYFLYDLFWAAHGMGRVDVDYMAAHEPVEQHADRGQMLLDGRRRDLGLKILDEGGDMERLHRREFLDALAGAPDSEAPRGVHIGPAAMRGY
jgi:hypothetical protein